MNTDLFVNLISNLCLVAFLTLLSYKGTEYIFSWWLRVNRTNTVIKKFYEANVFLEIKLPQEVNKSPAAMEIIFNAINQGLGHKPGPVFVARKNDDDGHGHIKKEPLYKWIIRIRKEFFEKYVSGSMRMWHSLEIVSDEGEIKFYLVTQKKNAEIFKSYTFSQYPGVEITEVEDYTLKYDYKTGGKSKIYVGRYKLKEKDYLPIKTYVDYGLDKDPKEEYKIDPLTPLLEAMAAANKGEKFWFQVLIRPTIDENWKKETEKRIDTILGIKRVSKEDVAADKKDGSKKHLKEGDIKEQTRNAMGITPREKHELEILQKNIEKPAFDTIIRMIYHVDDSANFNLNKGVFTVVNAMKSFNKEGYNTFGFETITIDSDYPFLDPTGLWTEGTRRYMWMLYRLRAGFYHEAEGIEGNWGDFKAVWHHWWVGKSWDWAMGQWGEVKEYYNMPGEHKHKGSSLDFVLNYEELATIWHFPGKAFGNVHSRVSSVKADPPKDLPI